MSKKEFINFKFLGAFVLVGVFLLSVIVPAESINNRIVYEVYDIQVTSVPGKNYVAYGGLKYAKVIKEYLNRIEPQIVNRDFI